MEGAPINTRDHRSPRGANLVRWRWRRLLLDALWPSATIFLGLVAWEAWVRLGDAPLYLVAAPTDIIESMIYEWRMYGTEALVTIKEIVLGFVAAMALALTTAVLIDASAVVGRLVYPLVVAAQVVPVIALAPLMLVWFGFGLLPKIMIVVLFAFFAIAIEAVAGLRSLQTEKLYLARSMGAPWFHVLLKLKLPHARPYIFAGLKLGAMLSVIGAVVAEFVGASAGLGNLLLKANGNLDTVTLFGGIGYLAMIGIIVWSLMSALDRVSVPGHRAAPRRDEHRPVSGVGL